MVAAKVETGIEQAQMHALASREGADFKMWVGVLTM